MPRNKNSRKSGKSTSSSSKSYTPTWGWITLVLLFALGVFLYLQPIKQESPDPKKTATKDSQRSQQLLQQKPEAEVFQMDRSRVDDVKKNEKMDNLELP